MRMTPFRMAFAVALLAATPFVVSPFVAAQAAQTPNVYSDMHWREIGPTRAGRARALAGVPSEPNVFYVGFDNGGVWRSTDYGSTWVPLFDKEPAGSIGAIAVAPSAPNVIYVGSGAGIIRPDLSTGDGMYKSTDAGKTWTHLGLRDSQMIADIAVDPKNPDRLFVAVLGHPYGPNEERGIFRSTDGGRTFQKVLYRDAYTSGNNVVLDPSNPQIVYATLWQQQQAFREGAEFGGSGGGNGIYKSTDGGTTWKLLTAGLPSVIEANWDRAREFAPDLRDGGRHPGAVDRHRAGPRRRHHRRGRLLQVDRRGRALDRGGRAGGTAGGAHAARRCPAAAADRRRRPADACGRPEARQRRLQRQHRDVAHRRRRRPLDGGPRRVRRRRLPEDLDNPHNPDTILVVSDQGAVVSANGGKSWSNWYTQPTAAMYHVTTDDAFPYCVCGGQQDSGRPASRAGRTTA